MGDDSRDWKEGSSQGKEEEEEEESRDSIELVCQLNVIDTGAVEKSKKRGRKEGGRSDFLPEIVVRFHAFDQALLPLPHSNLCIHSSLIFI